MVKTTTQGTPGVKKVLSALICLALLPVISAEAKTTGEDIYKEVIASTPIYDNPALDNYIRKLGEEIVAQSEMAGEKFTFTLLDSPDLNAFATRGNYVYVNRGLLNYINNEAQLVSVLAHEVGHITKKHVTGQEGQAIGAQVLSAVAGVLSGSAEVYEAGMKYSTSLMRSHGRNNELEADQAGAVYMAKLGYAPEEMLSMLSIMKDYETLQKDRAKAKGASKQTYHGIFSSHPRNDSRLRNVVTAAERLKGSSSRDNGVSTYRQLTEGLIWGENFLAKDKKPERYSDMTLRVRFDYPEGWKQNNNATARTTVWAPDDNHAKFAMTPIARTTQSPEEYLYNFLRVKQLKQGREISPAGLKGYSGILPGADSKPDQRIAVVYYKLNAFIFTGEVVDQAQFNDSDKLFSASIDSFRPISQREIDGQRPKLIHYVKATNATTYDALAKALKLSPTDTEDLRIINGHYPRGEPKAGDWVKIFKQ